MRPINRKPNRSAHPQRKRKHGVFKEMTQDADDSQAPVAPTCSAEQSVPRPPCKQRGAERLCARGCDRPTPDDIQGPVQVG